MCLGIDVAQFSQFSKGYTRIKSSSLIGIERSVSAQEYFPVVVDTFAEGFYMHYYVCGAICC